VVIPGEEKKKNAMEGSICGKGRFLALSEKVWE